MKYKYSISLYRRDIKQKKRKLFLISMKKSYSDYKSLEVP
jgi:hypothetical protein